MSVTYKGFETSAARIEKSRWQIENVWTSLNDEASASAFIKTSPPRDNRNLMGKSRLRLLLVLYSDRSQLYKQHELLKTAMDHGWTDDSFKFMIMNEAGGASVSESTDRISFAVQSPTDDVYPMFSLSLTEQYTDGRRRNADWVCILFCGPGLGFEKVKSLLGKTPFPSDFEPPISPDLMFLPTSILCWQVEEMTQGLSDIRKKILDHHSKIIATKTQVPTDLGKTLYDMRHTHLMLHRRWLFAQDLATKLTRSFDKIESLNSSGEYPVKYSPTLRYKVQAEAASLTILRHELDATPLRMDVQQTMIDSKTSILLARNSEIATDAARRDSTSMRTIAILTLLFLPGTCVASIFSMSVFNWQAKGQGEHVVSGWIWVYFTVTGTSTLMVMVIWITWFRIEDRKYRKDKLRWDDKMA